MAKVVMPLLSGQVRGKIGDIVFMRRGDFGINIARMKVSPSNPRTEKQQKVRHNISTLTKIYIGVMNVKDAELYKNVNGMWQLIKIADTETFGNTEKQAWEQYIYMTKKGYRVKGRLAFISKNLAELSLGGDPFKTPLTRFTLE